MAEEFSDTLPCLVLTTSQRIGRRSKPICPDRRWMFRDASRKPTHSLVIAARPEVT